MSVEITSADSADDTQDDSAARSRLVRLRPAIGVVGLLLLGIKYVQAQDDADFAADLEASALQYIQIYVPHIFEAILIIGAMIALYVVTRLAD